MTKPEGVQEYDGYGADIGKPLTPERRAYLEEQHKKHQAYLKSINGNGIKDEKNTKSAVQQI